MNNFYMELVSKIRYVWIFVGIMILLCVGLESISSLIIAVSIPNEKIGYDARINADTYKESDRIWLKDYYREFLKQHLVWEPYVYWRYAPYKGRYINIGNNGLRKTWNSAENKSQNPRKKRIFVFGGSTIWGTGTRDDFTIPSLISRILNTEEGLNVEVTSFGQSGYVTTQEVIALMRLLQNGQIPDVVIFYDGINDSFSAFQNNKAGIPQNEFNRYAEFNSGRSVILSARNLLLNSATVRGIKGLMNRIKRKNIINNNIYRADENLCSKAAGCYKFNMDCVNQLAARYGFRAILYWQPTIFTKNYKTEYEKKQELARFEVKDTFMRINKIIEKTEVANFTDLSGILKITKNLFTWMSSIWVKRETRLLPDALLRILLK